MADAYDELAKQAWQLQRLVMDACNRLPSASQRRQYKRLRQVFSTKMQDLAPRDILEIDDLRHLSLKLKEWEPEWAARRTFVRARFRRLTVFFGRESAWQIPTNDGARVGRRLRNTKTEVAVAANEAADGDAHQPEVSASDWTGMPSDKERARVVIRLAPAAIEGIEALIDNYSLRLDNRPPEPIDPIALEDLKALHSALETLIELAERELPLEAHLDKLRQGTKAVFEFASDTGELMLMGTKPILACLPIAWGTWALLSAICAPVTLTTLGPAMVASVATGYFGLALKEKAGTPA